MTKFTDYAFIVLSCLVTTQSATDGESCVLSAAAIAKSVNLQLPTVSKILKILVNSGLVKSYRGADGGYTLARDPCTITVNEVITSLEGKVSFTECSLAINHNCEHMGSCQLQSPWQKINLAINKILNNISISDIAYNKIEI